MLHLETAEAFQALVHANKHRLIVVDFYAQWCGPCRRIAPWLEKRAAELGEQVLFCKVDVDVNDETTKTYGIKAMPTFLFIRDARIVGNVKGAVEASIDAMINLNISAAPSPSTATAASPTTAPTK